MVADPQYWAIPAATAAVLAYLLAALAAVVLPKPARKPGSLWLARGAGFLGAFCGVWLVVYLVFFGGLGPTPELIVDLALGLGAYLASLRLQSAWLARLLFNLGLTLMALGVSLQAVYLWGTRHH